MCVYVMLCEISHSALQVAHWGKEMTLLVFQMECLGRPRNAWYVTLWYSDRLQVCQQQYESCSQKCNYSCHFSVAAMLRLMHICVHDDRKWLNISCICITQNEVSVSKKGYVPGSIIDCVSCKAVQIVGYSTSRYIFQKMHCQYSYSHSKSKKHKGAHQHICALSIFY